jgi:hypothetical protein
LTNKLVNFVNTKFALYENHPDPKNIVWKFCTKDHYLKMEEIFTKNAIFFEPFIIENFYDKEDFEELKSIVYSKSLKEIAYTKQMNKWEDTIVIPDYLINKAIQKTKEFLQTDDIELGYYLYAHHQISKSGKPFLQVHLDWSPGTYMIDLHIGGNRDWSFIAHDKEFITKPNDAIIVQPELDFHYRQPWNSDDPNEYYQVFFFHLARKDHWLKKFGTEYMNSEEFLSFQNQRLFIWEDLYKQHINNTPGLSKMVFGNDSNITENDKRIFGLDV